MAARDDILEYASQLLAIGEWSDYGPNGMQVIGDDDVTSIVTAVSSRQDVFEHAVAAGAGMLLVHHGLFWRDTPQVIDAHMRRRLKTLFDAGITLAAYHLPLDAHAAIGNNALIVRELGLEPVDTPFAVMQGKPLGKVGRYEQPVPYDTFLERVARVMQREPLHLGHRPDEVRTVAVCSGGAARQLPEAITLGADVFITGEPSEPSQAIALEGNVAFLAAGHNATEVFGIRELGRMVAAEFALEHTFVPVDNPV